MIHRETVDRSVVVADRTANHHKNTIGIGSSSGPRRAGFSVVGHRVLEISRAWLTSTTVGISVEGRDYVWASIRIICMKYVRENDPPVRFGYRSISIWYRDQVGGTNAFEDRRRASS